MRRRGTFGEARASRAAVVARAAAALLGLVVAACSGGPILANPPRNQPSPRPEIPPAAGVADPQPIVLPRDDGPHHRLTEWWYYTGHLRAADGRRFGFEYVIFRAERGSFPVTWAAHLAVTDETGGRFHYVQRSEIGPGVDRSPRDAAGVPTGFGLAFTGADPTRPETLGRPTWTMTGALGTDHLQAALAPDEAATAGTPGGLGLDLRVASSRPPALHGGTGWIDFGPAGSSYYYSRTRMAATGTLTLDGQALSVEGLAWFDHQWGDFIAVGGGGWDWFAVNLDDGTDLMVSLVRSRDGTYPIVYGTLVDAGGRAHHLARADVAVAVSEHWTSPRTGVIYPARWRITVPSEGLAIDLRPTVAAQELDTRATTGVVYWEGSQVVSASRNGRSVGGAAYVELTGYGPAEPLGSGAVGSGAVGAAGSVARGISSPARAARACVAASSAGIASRTVSIFSAAAL